MEMPRPGEAHKKLERLVGTWTGEETIHPSPFDPEGGPANAKVENRSSQEGFTVVQDYVQERNGEQSLTGHGVFSYDIMQQCYFLHWWDSLGFPLSAFKGDFDGDILTVSTQSPMGSHRATFDLSEEGKYSFKLELSPDGASWSTFMEGCYVRG